MPSEHSLRDQALLTANALRNMAKYMRTHAAEPVPGAADITDQHASALEAAAKRENAS